MQDEPELLAILERSTRTGIHVIGLRLVTYALGFVGSVLLARALGPGAVGATSCRSRSSRSSSW